MIKKNRYINSKSISKYIEIIEKTKRLSEREEFQYVKKAKKDKHCKQLLFNAHLGLVLSIAEKYASNHNETLEDLIQEGVRGLEHALDLFEPEKRNRFNTYARYWVRAYILKYFSDNVRSFKVPSDIAGKLGKINRVIEKLSKKSRHEPTDAEIARELDYETGYVTFLRKHLLPHFTMDIKVSGDGERHGNKGDITFGETLADNSRDDAGESLIRTDIIDKIKKAIQKLSKKERFVIENRYGLNDESEGMTLDDVGKKMGLTGSRVQQIQKMAEKRLKKAINH